MRTIFLFLLLATSPTPPATRTGAPPTIDWPDFFARVLVQGVEYSDRIKDLEGRRVRLRGYSIRTPEIAGALLLSREMFAASDAEETEIPFDAVGVIWKRGISLPPIPTRPTVEGTLRLGSRELGSQVVPIALEDAVPVYASRSGKSGARRR